MGVGTLLVRKRAKEEANHTFNCASIIYIKNFVVPPQNQKFWATIWCKLQARTGRKGRLLA